MTRGLAAVAALLLAGCATPEGVLSPYAPASDCAAIDAEMRERAERVAFWSNAGQARDAGVGLGAAGLALGAAPPGVLFLAASAIVTAAREFNVDLSADRERVRYLASERQRHCGD